MFREFLTGRSLIIHDTFELYANIKLFLNSLQSGAYPLWDPYHLWGAPFSMRLLQFGEFNPFLFLIVVLNKLGVGYFHAFMAYFMVYFFTGLVGLYLLANRIFKDSRWAYIAYLLFLFSSLGMALFSQIQMLFIFVPAVWFFYFSAAFLRDWQRRDLFGMTFALMVILATYVPFYFMTTLFLCLLALAAVYFKETKIAFSSFARFLAKEKLAAAFCAAALAVAAVIPAAVYLESKGSDCVIPSRHADSARAETQSLAMDYGEMTGGGLGVRMSFDDLFSGLDQSNFLNDGYAYLPVFGILILLLSLITRMSRRALVLLCFNAVLLLVSLGDAAPVHKLLYDHVFFFRLFRNIYFFMPFLLAGIVLYAAEQMRLILEDAQPSDQKPFWKISAVVLLHGAFFVFLFQKGAVPVSSYITAAASLVFFVLCFSGLLPLRGPYFLAVVSVLIMLQPAEVLHAFNKNSSSYRSDIIQKSIKQNTLRPGFSFLRQEQRVGDYVNGDSEKDPKYFLNWSVIAMQDSPGFITYHHGYPTRWSYVLSENIPEDSYREYVRHKFWLYSQTEAIDGNNPDFAKEAKRLETRQDIASVFPESGEHGPEVTLQAGGQAEAVDRDSSALRVVRFNPNAVTLKTNLTSPKFLVYNDSFHRFWRVTVNGQEKRLYRANVAFKGVWVPAGEATVIFSYRPPAGEILYAAVLMAFYGFFFVWAGMYVMEKLRAGYV